jgi:hypothetical protein
VETFFGAGQASVYRGCGSVSQLKPPTNGGPGKETQFHIFTTGSDGSSPGAGVMLNKRTLFGTTPFGGGSGCGGDNCRTVFEVAP